jgi:hypothetical protein
MKNNFRIGDKVKVLTGRYFMLKKRNRRQNKIRWYIPK